MSWLNLHELPNPRGPMNQKRPVRVSKNQNANTGLVQFLYGTGTGRALLGLIQQKRLDKLAVWFLRSPLSRPMIRPFARRHHIPLEGQKFGSWRQFFLRPRDTQNMQIDKDPEHLISPCDGWLSAFPVQQDSAFAIKGARYRLEELIRDPQLARRFQGGQCLIFRLCPADYHHYCYFDSGHQGPHHFIEGTLHSVQPLACQVYPVYIQNRRCWSLLETRRFGPVVQAEIGAMIVGGIVNRYDNVTVERGMEKGYFDLAGSTILLFFEKDRIRLLPKIAQASAGGREYRVYQGMQIGQRLEKAEKAAKSN